MRVQKWLIGKLITGVVMLGGLAFVLSGCGDKDWKLQNQPPELAAIGAKSVTEGQSITFSVSATDPNGDALTLWVENQPPNSQFADSGNGRGTFFFNPNYDQDGTLHPVFKVSDGYAVDSEIVAVTIVNVAYTHHAGIITQSEIWTSAGSPHLVAGDIEINSGAVVTIQPGAVVHFVEGRRIRVGYASPGGLIADGTPDQKILFTSMMPVLTPGIWDGLTFSTNCLSSSVLDNCIIEYGGNNGYANVFVDNGAVSITNCTIRESSTNGIFFGGDGNAPDFQGNVITSNREYPVAVSCNYLGRLGGSSLTGNVKDTLIVRGTLVSTSATWDTLGVPLRVTELFDIGNGAILTITAGNRLVFDKLTGITVGNASAGTLVAEGTVEKPIWFTSTAANPGAWEGLAFYGLAGSGCSLDNCVVEYGAQNQQANIYVKDSEVSIRNTTIRKSKQHGVYFDGNGRFSNFSNDTITDNALNPVVISARYAGRLPGSTLYTGNGTDQIAMFGATMAEDAIWTDLGIPYYLDTGQVRIDNDLTLTIAAGNTVYFGADAGITVGQTGSGKLIADGTDSRIVLTAADPTKLWSGIHFMSHTQESSILKTCTISYGGCNRSEANIWLTDCHVAIGDCRIVNSGQDGIYFEGNSYATDFQGNTITANAEYPVTIDCDNVGRLSPNNDYTGNLRNGFQIRGSTIKTSATWSNPGVPLIIGSLITINSGVQLTLSPGIVLKFDRDMGLTVAATATLIADGTAGQITLTNNPTATESPFWKGIVFLPGASSSSILKNCYIHKGGSETAGAGKRPGIVHIDNAVVAITDCLIDSSNYNGLYIAGTGCITEFHGNTITGCNNYPVRVEGGSAGCLNPNNDFTGNGQAGQSRDAIQIAAQPVTVTVNSTWPKLPIPYYVDTLAVSGATMTLSPGVTIQFNRRGYIRFETSGTLIANGTAADSITFTSTNTTSTTNNWGYLKLQGAGGSSSSLQYCIIEFGGNFLSSPKGTVWVNSATPIIRNCRVSNSRSWGIYLEGSPVPSKSELEANNAFAGNTSGTVGP